MRTRSFFTAKAGMNWNSELQITVFKTFGPLASLDIHISTSGTEQYQWATAIVWNISMAFLLRRKLFRKICEKYLPVLACWSVPCSLQNAGVRSHLRFWADSRVPSFTVLVCNQKYQWMLQPKNNERRHTIRLPLLLTNSLFFGASWHVYFLNTYQCG